MHRSILTGIFVFGLTAGAFGVAVADEAPATVATAATPIVASQAATAVEAAPVSAGVTSSGPASEASAGATSARNETPVAPTAGADLAMWNAAPAGAPEATNTPVKALSPLRRFASGIVSRSSALASSLTRSALRFIGVPYVFGGTRTTGFDCSGYVQHVFGMNGVHVPRTADAQFDAARRIHARLVPGDLVFFHTYAPGVSHVGIYIGNNKFVHASSSRGVAVSSLHDRYWAPRYLGAKRVVGT